MAKYVKLKKVWKMLHGLGGCDAEPGSWVDGWDKAIDAAIRELDDLPAADVQEVRHGKWLLERELDGTPYCFHCSICDDDFGCIGITTAYDYCPNCGAKMDGEDGEQNEKVDNKAKAATERGL